MGIRALPFAVSRPGCRTIILTRPEGQLGNRLFLSATLLAHCAERNLRFLNPALGEYAVLFEGTRTGWLPGAAKLRRILAVGADFLTSAFSEVGGISSAVRILDITESHDRAELEYNLASSEFANLCNGSGWLILRGWKFRDHAALKHQHAWIRKIFHPIPSIQVEVSNAISVARRKVDRLIGVHVRQGDYRHWLGGRYYFENAKYLEWMRQAASLWPDERVGFLVCTNGTWEGEQIEKSPIFRGPGSAVGDMYSLAECDGIMGPPSSFSLWASYYNRVPLHMLESADQQIHPVTFTLHQQI